MATSDATASFAIDMGITGAEDAVAGAAALEDLQKKINGDIEALAGMQKALRLLKGSSVENAVTIESLNDKIKAQKATVASATGGFLKLGGSFKKAKPDVDAHARALEALRGSIQATGSPLGGLVSGFGKLQTAMGGGIMAAGLIGVALAIVAVGAAAISAAVSLVKFGLAAADARRSEELHLEGLTKLRVGYWSLAAGYGQVADKASFLQSMIDKISSRVSIGRDKVAEYTEQLYRMGLRSGNLQAALEGATITASAQGDSAAQAFIGMAQGAAFAGRSIRGLADDAKARLGGIVARQMLSLNVQTKKFHESLAFLFSGVKLESFLAGLNKITELFSANTESGLALKDIIETIFNPFFSGSAGAATVVKRFFQGMILGAYGLIHALFPLRLWLAKTFAGSDVLQGMTAQKAAIEAGTVAVFALAGALVVGALALGVFAAAALVLVSPFLLVGATVFGAYELIKDIKWGELGGNIVRGIANGILSGAHWALDAIKNLGSAIVTQFERKLIMHSPSELFRAKAFNIGAGVALGVDDSAPLVQRAVGRMAPEPDFAPRAPGQAAQAAQAPANAGASLTIGTVNLHTSAKDPAAQAQDFAAQLVALLQGTAVQIGAPAHV